MGTRAQVFIKDTGVYFYQHWDGQDLINTVTIAISRKLRWDDPEYLSRVIFCQMIGDDMYGETGYGISNSQHGDIEYLVEVDCKKQNVTETKIYNGFNRTFTFEEICKLPLPIPTI